MTFFEGMELPRVPTAWALGAGLRALLCLSAAGAAQATPSSQAAEARLHQAWRAAIASAALPGKGCFTAAYPGAVWRRVACARAPARLYEPAHWPAGGGVDYTAKVGSPISSAVGSFPSIAGLVSEKDMGVSDQYSLQLNTQYFTSPACADSYYPPYCFGWQQFIFAQSGGKKGTSSAFMVYWLLNYGPVCPSGWNQAATNCWSDSSAVSVPHQKLSALGDLQLSGSAVSGNNDTVQLTTSTNAYAESGSDAVLALAGSWKGTEYNVFGDGGGTEAIFNKGTDITVNIQLTDGSTTAPKCKSDRVFSYETNNLNLGTCQSQGGVNPSIAYAESN